MRRRTPSHLGGLLIPILRRGARALRNEARLYWDVRTGGPRAVGPGIGALGLRLGLFDQRAADGSPGDLVAIRLGGEARFGSLARAYRAHSGGALVFEDFVGSANVAPNLGAFPWVAAPLGAGATLSKVADTAVQQRGGRSFGVVRIETSAGSGDGVALHLGSNAARLLSAPPTEYAFAVAKVRLPASTTHGNHWAGLWSDEATDPDAGLANTVSGIGWAARPAGSSVNWFGVVRAGTSESTVDLGVVANAIPHELGWQYEPEAGGRVRFYVDGSAVGLPVSVNLPIPGAALSLMVGCRSTNATASTLDCDYVGIFLPTGSRW